MTTFFHSHTGEFCALGTALLWTLCTLAWTSAGKRIGSMTVCFMRLVFALLLLIGYNRIFCGQWLPFDVGSRIWTILMFSGFLGFFVADLLIFKAFLIIGPRMTLLLQALTPVTVVLITSVRQNEPFGAMDWLGMAITLAGVVWVVLERPESPKETHHRKDFAFGVALAAASAIFSGISQIFSKEAVGRIEIDPFSATLIRIIGGTILFPVLLTLIRRWDQIGAARLHPKAIFIVFLGTLSGPFLGVALNLKALTFVTCTTGVVTTLIATAPVMVLPFSILLYKEKVSPRAAIGAAISVLGVAVLMFSK
jgi:drug/metabolite transporter (DMT)-like permease